MDQNHPSSATTAVARIRYGAMLCVAAFVVIGVVFGIAVSAFASPTDIIALVGSVTTVAGTIIGAFFGVAAGAAEAEQVKAKLAQAEIMARVALAKLDPHTADDILRMLAGEIDPSMDVTTLARSTTEK